MAAALFGCVFRRPSTLATRLEGVGGVPGIHSQRHLFTIVCVTQSLVAWAVPIDGMAMVIWIGIVILASVSGHVARRTAVVGLLPAWRRGGLY